MPSPRRGPELEQTDAGGPGAAAEAVIHRFSDQLSNVRTALDDLAANFADPDAQGPSPDPALTGVVKTRN